MTGSGVAPSRVTAPERCGGVGPECGPGLVSIPPSSEHHAGGQRTRPAAQPRTS